MFMFETIKFETRAEGEGCYDTSRNVNHDVSFLDSEMSLHAHADEIMAHFQEVQ